MDSRDRLRVSRPLPFSFQIAGHKQLQKYTPENMRYYDTFVEWVRTVPVERLKFLDECHFVPKGSFLP